MQRSKSSWCIGIVVLIAGGCGTNELPDVAKSRVQGSNSAVSNSETDIKQSDKLLADMESSGELASPVRMQADGEPIDIGKISSIAHAGPWIADVDCDGDRDLLVGDFPGYFWFFENENSDDEPQYTSRGKLQAGGADAKTPVY